MSNEIPVSRVIRLNAVEEIGAQRAWKKKMGDAEMSQEVVKNYLVDNGGVTRNVDLVRHFRKFLQPEDVTSKGD